MPKLISLGGESLLPVANTMCSGRISLAFQIKNTHAQGYFCEYN
jgi:hypothetical protein